jgi:hypothetical protein
VAGLIIAMNEQCIRRRKYSLGFRVGLVGHGVVVKDGPKRAKTTSSNATLNAR